jgi:hypothetical protein
VNEKNHIQTENVKFYQYSHEVDMQRKTPQKIELEIPGISPQMHREETPLPAAGQPLLPAHSGRACAPK